MPIAENLAQVRARIADAAGRSGRQAAEITLIAVSKTFSAADVREAWVAGHRDFGENKVQEGLQKIADSAGTPATWHLIGHLQSNKVRKVPGAFAWIHSIDSLDLLKRLDDAAAAMPDAVAPQILIQVDLAGEATKFGAPPDEARRCVDGALAAKAVRLAGLMLLPPWSDDPEQTRPWFARLRELRERWVAEGIPRAALRHLSMGMSHDFEAAIEEGATIVRVGTAIFGTRNARA